MISADDADDLSCLPSDLDHGIDLITHDVGVDSLDSLLTTVSSLTLLNPRPSYWAPGPLLVDLIFLSCLVFPLVVSLYRLSARLVTSES